MKPSFLLTVSVVAVAALLFRQGATQFLDPFGFPDNGLVLPPQTGFGGFGLVPLLAIFLVFFLLISSTSSSSTTTTVTHGSAQSPPVVVPTVPPLPPTPPSSG